MSESIFRSFAESGLPAKYRTAYSLARDAHQFKQVKFDSAVFPYLYHPVAMAEALIKLGYSAHVVQAGLLHDVTESTPLTFDHLERAVDFDVHTLVYELSPPDDLQELSGDELADAYGKLLLRASPEAQSIKLLDLILTSTALGSKDARRAVHFADQFEQILQCLPDADRRLITRAEYVIKWARKRQYEHQVNHYDLPFKASGKGIRDHHA